MLALHSNCSSEAPPSPSDALHLDDEVFYHQAHGDADDYHSNLRTSLFEIEGKKNEEMQKK